MKQSVRPTTSRRLNAFDLSMCGVHDTLQKAGDVGFEAMSVVELDGRLEFTRLQTALVELSHRHPVLTAKLRRGWTGCRWDWKDAESLSCQRLACGDRSVLQDKLVEILSTARDITQEPGIEFYLIDLAGQSDVFVTRVNHVLVDHLSAKLVLQELTQILNGDSNSAPRPATNLPEEYRKSFSFARRYVAMFPGLVGTLLPGWTADSVTPRTLQRDCSPRKSTRQCVLVRQLTASETAATLNYTRKLSRMPSTSMAVLAGAIRVFSHHSKKKSPNDIFRVGLGTEVIQQSLDNFHPQNLSTVIRLSLKEDELDDRAGCVRRLNDQIRMSLKKKSELGFLELISEYRWCYPLVKLVSGRIARRTFSFFYAFFRASEEDYDQFAGVPVKKLSFFAPAWRPLGMTLLVTHFRDHIELTLTYLTSHLSAEDAEKYCEEVIRELTGQAE